MIWKQVPFLRLIIPLVLGISAYIFLPANNFFPALVTCLMAISGMITFNFLPHQYKHKYIFTRGIFVHLAIFSLGYLMAVINNIRISEHWYGQQLTKNEYVLLRINDEPQAKPKTRKVRGEVIALLHNNQSVSTKGEAFVYFKNSPRADSLLEGDIILIKNNFKPIAGAANPGDFDYAKYCHTKKIFHSAFVKDNEWQFTHQHSEDLHSFFSKISASTRAMLAENIKDRSSLGIAEALLIGYKGDIDKEVWQAYSNTGIVHIIAISGMHMAFIYTGLRWLLFLIPFMKRKRILSLSLAVIFMWLFASVTGFPPSVTRAAVMFTFIGVGEMLDRDTSTLNNLLASAFFLLCIHPNWLQDIGFQLSYLAVLSLFIFFNPIYRWFYFPKTLPDTLWKLLAGTIAAQILTFPLCIYYFHQFPLLFIVTNLIAVPLTTCILYAELILLIFYWFKPLALVIGNFISNTIAFLNKGVMYLDNFSFAVWKGIQINIFQMALLFAFITFIAIWLLQKKNKFVPFVLVSIFFLISSFTIDRYVRLKQEKFLIYSIPKESVLEFIVGESYYSPDKFASSTDTESQNATVASTHLYFGVKKTDSSIVHRRSHQAVDLFQFGHKRIARVNNENFSSAYPLQVDILIMSRDCKPNATWISKNFIPSQIVLDSSIPWWQSEKYTEQLSSLQVPMHIVNKQGSFTVGL